MLDKDIIRAMAEAERMMDEGKLPWVWAPSPEGISERMAVSQEVMDDLNLVTGQNVNSMIRDAILVSNLEHLGKKLAKMAQEMEDKQLKDDFDFRSMM
jgi:antitoxin component of MazEF toxin-antitoxin module